MYRDKIQRWLKLPDGPWPPDHYTLIGLPPGEGNAAEIEARILERLELLRRYQLPHPDEATEGMSMLARALDCLTSPEARRAYDQKLGVDTVVEDVQIVSVDEVLKAAYADIPVPEATLVPEDDLPNLPVAILLPDIEDESDNEEEPPILLEPILEPVLELIPEPPPLPVPKRRTKLAEELPPAIVLPEETPTQRRGNRHPKSNRPPSRRRERYADAVRIRRVLKICDRAHPYFTNHEHTFTKPEDAVGLIACLADLKPLLRTVDDLIGGVNEPGHLLATIARQRLMIDTFRNLLPSQRERLAKDFRAAHYRLANYYRELREDIQSRNAKGPWREFCVPLVRYYAKFPELGLIPIGVLALVVAILRSHG
ncbi:hypothetical protein [Zavarzinella formosa]|uniref:hypothetical protein n=1 Tax=Zavarzinella formosa TaxID=360055 RepID=UPI0002FD430C|nr:hypothetical protein [Zavarzinella formosa]